MTKINKIKTIKNILDINTKNGQFFTVVFTKKNGEMRKMNCRRSVTKYLKGGKSTTNHKENLMTVFDMVKKQYRSINLETVKSLAVSGQVFEFA